MSLETALETLAAEVRALRTTVDAFLAVATGAKPAPAKEVDSAATVSPKRPGRPAKNGAAGKEAAPPPKATPAPADAVVRRPVRYDEVRTAITGYADRHGDPEARKLLAKYAGADGTPCKSAKEVKPDDYAALIAACGP